MRRFVALLLALAFAPSAALAADAAAPEAAAPSAVSEPEGPRLGPEAAGAVDADARRAEAVYSQRMRAGRSAQPRRSRSVLTPQRVGQLKAATALAGALLLAWGAAARTGEAPARRRLRDGLLLALAGAAALGWWNFTAFNHPSFGHASDTYHYYVGSKYYAELGYSRLYLCTAVADLETGQRAQVEHRYLRDLETNELTDASAALEHPETCTSHFSPERWTNFKRDITWFRNRVSVRRWQETQTDHGYNATPVWTALGGALANRVPATDGGILALRLLDPLLLAAMWTAVAAAFGWRAACVALLFWGTNYPAQYGWTGGSILRQGWLVASVAALCALRRARPATAGALLGVAIALRIFPVFIALALGFKALLAMARTRRWVLASDHRRLLAGALASAGALFAFSLAAGGGLHAWSGFIANSRTHLATPLRNHMGLRTVVAYEAATSSTRALEATRTDRFAAWKDARRSLAGQRRWLFAGLLAAYLALLARVVSRHEDWVVGVLGLGLITLAAELTCYYSAGLLAFGLLWPRRPSIGVALCLLSAIGWWIAGSGRALDEVFTGISLASVIFVVFATARLLPVRSA